MTERAAGGYADLDLRPTQELVELINAEDALVAPSVRLAAPQLAAAIDAIGERLSAGGRLLYVGAGTSGRLALVDAAECVPTFGVPPTTVVAIVAGGAHAHAIAQESAEDDEEAGAADLIAVGRRPERRRRRHLGRRPHAVRTGCTRRCPCSRCAHGCAGLCGRALRSAQPPTSRW